MYSIVETIYYYLFVSGTQLSKRFNESLTIQCPCEDRSICDWYHNNQSVPSQWVQANGDLMLPANDWNVYGVIISWCGSVNYAYQITSPGMLVHVHFLCNK